MSISNSSYGKDKIRELLDGGGRLHFVGISGAGMAPLAELCLFRGHAVSGSDLNQNEAYLRLSSLGARLSKIHSAEAVGDAAAVVYSLAVSEDNEEIAYARERGIPLISRAELLGAISGGYSKSVGISGTHGKSTTVAMTSEIFSSGGLSPTVVSGATLPSGESLRTGAEDLFIYEACEYRDSFLLTEPSVSVILNVELDHTDYFHSEAELEESFLEFARSARDLALVNTDGEIGRRIFERLDGKKLSFGSTKDADFRYKILSFGGGRVDFSLYFKCRSLGEYSINTIGRHLCEDAVAAIAVSYLIGVNPNTAREALLRYSGIARRLESLGRVLGREIIYDYAHHPSELSAVISSVKENLGKCTVIFRPHTYSRTEALWDGFVAALREADFVVLTDVFAAREREIPGVNSSELARAIGRRAVSLSSGEVVDYVLRRTSGTILLMGAGEVEDIKRELLKRKE